MTNNKNYKIIKNWQLHHLDKLTKMEEDIFETHFKQKMLLDPGPVIFTGTVVKDPTGKWKSGFHMKSSFIVSIDRKKGFIQTLNTLYKIKQEGGDVIPDLGNKVLDIFY